MGDGKRGGRECPQRPRHAVPGDGVGVREARLVMPSVRWRESFLEAAGELRAEGSSSPEAAMTAEGFEAHVAGLADSEAGQGLPDGWLPATTRWLVRRGRWIGRVEIRHGLTESLREWGGHAGYVVRPSERGRGYGHELMRHGLAIAAGLGLAEVLVTCYATNAASRAVAEGAGGTLEDERPWQGGPPRRRYWVPTGSCGTVASAAGAEVAD